MIYHHVVFHFHLVPRLRGCCQRTPTGQGAQCGTLRGWRVLITQTVYIKSHNIVRSHQVGSPSSRHPHPGRLWQVLGAHPPSGPRASPRRARAPKKANHRRVPGGQSLHRRPQQTKTMQLSTLQAQLRLSKHRPRPRVPSEGAQLRKAMQARVCCLCQPAA